MSRTDGNIYGGVGLARVEALCLALLFVLVLSGCGSSKRGAGNGGAAYRPAEERGEKRPVVNYSAEETDGMGRDLVEEARLWLGTPYRYGGQDRSGTDCSGLVLEIYRTVCGTKLPRKTSDQMAYCTELARNKARVGDLVFFGSGKSASAISHVGLYIGQGKMIHASSSRGVTVSSIDSGYWGDRFQGVGRVEGAYVAWAEANGKKDAPVKTESVVEEASTDLLDLIISQKADSIFSNQFMD